MDYKHIRNITELFVREFSECKSFSELILGYTLCNHNIESLTKEKFCLNVGNELDCPAYRLIWITPNGTLLFTKPVPLCVELMDHRETVTYVLKKYYKLVPAKEKTEILKNFFGNIYDNPKLINFFESESNTKDCIPKGLYGDFDSEEFGYRKNNKKSLHVVAIDYGIKKNILRYFSDFNCKVTVVSCKTNAQKILNLKPNGIFLSNGPGDPAATGKYAIPIIQKLIKKNLPTFGICLGHQILALALGAKTKKMSLGHRGANHPVKNLLKNNVEITSQNHGFEVIKNSLARNVQITHQSLFDNSIEGIRLKNKPVYSVQYHPEASPGPHDSSYLFDQFIDLLK